MNDKIVKVLKLLGIQAKTCQYLQDEKEDENDILMCAYFGGQVDAIKYAIKLLTDDKYFEKQCELMLNRKRER